MILHRDKSTVQAAPRVLNYSTDHLVNYLMDILIKGENYGTAIGSVLKEIGIIISADRVSSETYRISQFPILSAGAEKVLHRLRIWDLQVLILMNMSR